jgi:diguanylate cyclase (GGDEF)-like protein
MKMDYARRFLNARKQPSLQRLFTQTHFLVLLIALFFSGTSLSLLSFFTLNSYTNKNLQLIASTVSYRVEAGVVFNDKMAVQETINKLSYRDELSEIKVLDQHQQLIAYLKPEQKGSLNFIHQFFNQYIFAQPVIEPIMHDNQRIGEVWLVGNASGITNFLGQVLLGLLSCLIITMISVSYFSARAHAYIVNSFKKMTSVANLVREQRAFNLRLPPAKILELEELSQDFNSLLDEIEQWHQHIKAENDSLAHKAMHDSLTGLANRGYFEAQLETLFHQAQYSQNPMALLFIDNDDFKLINDNYGHAAGDFILIEMAERLKLRLREKDIIARLGGDEFAVILPQIIDKKNATAVAEAMLSAIKRPITLPSGQVINISVSIGIALSNDAKTPELLLASADSAMYQAKLTPYNSWSLFSQKPI